MYDLSILSIKRSLLFPQEYVGSHHLKHANQDTVAEVHVDFLVKLNSKLKVDDMNNLSFGMTGKNLLSNYKHDNPLLFEYLRSGDHRISNEYMLKAF